MKNPNCKGNTLVEAIVSLSILCIVILSMLTLFSVIAEGQKASAEAYDEGIALNTLRDEVAQAVKANPDKSPVSMAATAASVTAAYPGWRCEVVSQSGQLLNIAFFYQTRRGEHVTYAKICTEALP
jgi:Tfp pilus assembly protein PilV